MNRPQPPASTPPDTVLSFSTGRHTDYPRDSGIPALFEAHARKTPEAVALRFDGGQLTYRELNQRANRLARELQRKGVQLDQPVGILAERTPETLIGLLAILKAGGAYLPLDPGYPAERLNLLIEDSGMTVLVGQGTALQGLRFQGPRVELPSVEQPWLSVDEDAVDVSGGAGPEHLAFVLFTSGSTGKPKGVCIPHRGVASLVLDSDFVGFTSRDRVCQSATLSFDGSTLEIWGALLNGATLCLFSKETLLSPSLLAGKLRSEQATVAFLTTSLFHQLAATIPEALSALRVLVVGGDVLDPKWVARVKEHGGPRHLLNIYGPTECTTCVTFLDVRELPPPGQALSIGAPVANTQVYVLDERLALLPVGEVGELYLGGVGLARGYLNRPDLTRERFIHSPFSTEPGARLYRTGDRARWLPDGNLEFLGRTDHQVKLRGVRIELPELEAVLRAHPVVGDGVVRVREDVPGDKRLVAYVSPREGQTVSAAGLREYLGAKLPAFMLPHAFVVLERLPLKANGKVDHEALPAPRFGTEAGVAPRTLLEGTLARLWMEVLRAEKVGIRDAFLESGGDSLLALQLIERMNQALGTRMSVRALFDHPTIEELAGHIEAALAGGRDTGLPALHPVDRTRALPLSYAQRQLWLLCQVSPRSAFYNEPFTLTLPGDVQPEALEGAFLSLISRHEVLRTTFENTLDGPVQRVGEGTPFRLRQVDLRPVPERLRAAKAMQLATQEAREAFDLEKGPLLRATLVRLSGSECRLYLVLHHLIIDGFTMATLFHDLHALYVAARDGTSSVLPPVPLQYGDFAVWQVGPRYQEALAPHLDYWKRMLAGAPSLELPSQRARPLVESFRGAKHYVRLPKELLEALKALSRREGSTLFMTMLSALGALLHRYSGSEDFVIGTTFSGRHREELRSLSGMFVNVLPLRLRFPEGVRFRELLGQVRQSCLEAMEHQEAPLLRVVEAVNPPRTPGGNPLFQVSCTMEPAIGVPGSDWKVEPYDVDTGTSKLDLSIELDERPEGLVVRMEYSLDLFDTGMMVRLGEHFLSLLQEAVTAPETPVARLELLSEQEQRQLLDWAQGPLEGMDRVVSEDTLHGLFEAQVERAPAALALVFEDRQLSYRELNAEANRLAHHLRSLGVRPGDLVGVCVHRSIEMMVGILGALKAGAAYVPLDPTYPEARLRFMAGDAGLRLILAQEATRPLVSGAEAPLLCLDAARDVLARAPTENPRVPVTGDDLAYVIYTSGSTGQPKGVLLGHRSVVHTSRVLVACCGFESGNRVLQLARFGFDVSVAEIFPTLITGATLYLAPPAESLVGEELAGYLETRRIQIAVFPPAVLSVLPWRELPELKTLLVGGDECPAGLVDTWAPGRRFLNGYGPTETTMIATAAECTAGEAKPPIGRPIPGYEVYLLDRALQPVPVGVQGHLYIGGAGLARGYLRRPELDAERFIPHPLSAEPGARLYKSGDIARYREDGAIEFLGRSDQQLKLRGFRIELGEIETALREQPGVADAVVVARELAGEKHLIGYLTARDGGAREGLPSLALKERLLEKLPPYMVPRDFVVVESFPLTFNGKLDRKALPPPPARERSGGGEASRTAASTERERALEAIWCRVLGVEQVGTREGFFEAGGNSLLLARVQAELASGLGVQLNLATLFQFPTIEALARRLDELSTGALAMEERPSPTPKRGRTQASARSGTPPEAIAVIGRSGRFPGARTVEALWKLLVEGREGLSRFSDEELRTAGESPLLLAEEGYVRAAGLLEDAECFDAGFFGYSPQDARLMDPQLRLFLECAWEAFEDAGYDPKRLPGRAGVFAGSGVPRYWLEQVLPRQRSQAGASDTFRAVLGNPWQFLATATSYQLGLKGPALTVQTACSTSLVAVHLACQSLLTGESDVALAGGVSLHHTTHAGYLHEPGGILSPDGHCRPFDARGGGTVPSSGVGIVVLKRLEDALRDGDSIHAVIRGSAINNDGSGKVGFTAPSVEGQRDVIRQAHAAAGVDPRDITYVEAHGTATPMGDPIEVQALRLAFGGSTGPASSCALGSLKGNLGHLDSAAGVAGLIKATLALEHGFIPGTPHFEHAHPELELGPFHVSREARPWDVPVGAVRRAGVSSFGIGGTNAHVVVEEAPRTAARASAEAQGTVLVLSARSAEALEEASRSLAVHLEGHPQQPLADVAFTLQEGRASFDHRRAVACRSHAEAIRTLRKGGGARRASTRAPEVVFLFPGMGTQEVGMGEAWYRREPVYREAFDRCAELFARELGRDLRTVLFAAGEGRARAEEALLAPSLNMATIFSTEYALARLLVSWGIRPSSLIGHSLGEYTAACVSGILALEDAVALVALRGRICDGMPPSGMLVVPLSEEALHAKLGAGLAIAAVNGSQRCVVSGALAELDAFEARLRAEGLLTRRLPLSGGFHSPLVEPAMGPLTERARSMRLRAPALPVVSNVTGDWLSEHEATDPSYWARHLRGTVRFSEGLAKLLQAPDRILLEVGPGRTLSSLALLHPLAGPERLVLGTLGTTSGRRGVRESDELALLEAVGELWAAGVPVKWEALRAGERTQRVSLPTYPFERKRYALEPLPVAVPRTTAPREVDGASARDVVESVWKELLGVESLRSDSHFFELGGNSLLAVRMNRELQARLKVSLSIHALLERPTLAELSRRVQEELTGAEGAPRRGDGLLIQLQEGLPGQPPLFFVQPIGGTVYTYLPLAEQLGPAWPIHAFRASGLEPGEVLYRDVPSMARTYVEALLERQPQGPYWLGGHSSGGVIAYEMAGLLKARGHSVAAVFQVDTITVEQSQKLGIRSVEDVVRMIQSFRDTSPHAAEGLLAAMETDSRLRDVVLATNQALATYDPGRYDVPLVYLKATERDAVLDAHADAWWRRQTAGAFQLHEVPGNHFTVMESPFVLEVARRIHECLSSRTHTGGRHAVLEG